MQHKKFNIDFAHQLWWAKMSAKLKKIKGDDIYDLQN